MRATQARVVCAAPLGALERKRIGCRTASRTHRARVDAEQLTARILAAESEAEAERAHMLADLDAANAEANRLAKQLEDTSLDAQELAATAEELLSIADAELEGFRAEQNRLQAEVADALEEHGQLLGLVENLEAALERTAAALHEHEQTAAAVARESATRRAEFDAERTRLLNELETARIDFENARSEIELVHNELEMMKSEAAMSERHSAPSATRLRRSRTGLWRSLKRRAPTPRGLRPAMPTRGSIGCAWSTAPRASVGDRPPNHATPEPVAPCHLAPAPDSKEVGLPQAVPGPPTVR